MLVQTSRYHPTAQPDIRIQANKTMTIQQAANPMPTTAAAISSRPILRFRFIFCLLFLRTATRAKPTLRCAAVQPRAAPTLAFVSPFLFRHFPLLVELTFCRTNVLVTPVPVGHFVQPQPHDGTNGQPQHQAQQPIVPGLVTQQLRDKNHPALKRVPLDAGHFLTMGVQVQPFVRLDALHGDTVSRNCSRTPPNALGSTAWFASTTRKFATCWDWNIGKGTDTRWKKWRPRWTRSRNRFDKLI